MTIWQWVALGSALGSATRFGARELLQLAGWSVPWDTLFVNISGSLAIGLLAALAAPTSRLVLSPHLRQFAMTGFCGGYTTFSIFSLETLMLLEHTPLLAALNLMLTGATCMLSVWLGFRLGMLWNRSTATLVR